MGYGHKNENKDLFEIRSYNVMKNYGIKMHLHDLKVKNYSIIFFGS